MEKPLLIFNARLVDRDIDVKRGAILVRKNRIEGFPSPDAVSQMISDSSIDKLDANGMVLMPSFVDMHVHFRDPGQTQKEDLETGCQSAVAGGYGTVVLMPNTSPVVSSQDMAVKNMSRAEKMGLLKVYQSVSITDEFDGKTTAHIDSLDKKNIPLITEDGHEVEDSAVMLDGMKKAATKKIIVACHSEDPFLAAAAKPLRKNALELLNKKNVSAQDKKLAKKYLQEANSILAAAEDAATFRNIRLARDAKVHVHLCHVSTRESLDAVRRAKSIGQKVTCEVTPHHLGLNSESASTCFQIVNPPLRAESDRQAVVDALFDGTADVISTDHAPHTLHDKVEGCPGFSGLETSFALCYSVLCKENGMKLGMLSEKMSARPSEILGLKNQGLLVEGYDANLVLVDTESEWTVRGQKFASKGKYTPLEGKKVFGKIVATIYRGSFVYRAFGYNIEAIGI